MTAVSSTLEQPDPRQADAAPLSVTYAIQDFNKTGPMRGPFMICKGFVQAGWDTDMVAMRNDQNGDMNLIWGSVPLHKVGNGSRKNGLWSMSQEMLRRRKSHITLSYVWDWHCYALAAARRMWGQPFGLILDAYVHHAPWDKQDSRSRLQRELRFGVGLRNANIILAEAPFIYENAKRYFPQAEVLMVPACVWENEWQAIEAAWAKEDSAAQRQPLILYVGQILPRKGLHDLLTAFGDLAAEFPDWNVELRGPCPDGAYLQQLTQMAAANGLGGRVRIEPGLSGEALYRCYRSCAIYCMPTYSEGMPTSIIEAMYFGGAIIAGNAGYVSFQLDDGKCGLLLRPGDIDSLRAHLRQLMASPDLREQYRQRARQRVHDVFVWERYFEAVEAACKRAIRKSNAV